MKKEIIEELIDTIDNMDYEFFKFEQLLSYCEETDKESYIKVLHSIRNGVMLKLEKKIKTLKKELIENLKKDTVNTKVD